MKAEEMFEKLGYTKTSPSKSMLCYENKEAETCITFITNEYKGNRINIYPLGDNFQDSGMLTYSEIMAIQKQCEELGWNNELFKES